MGSNGPPPLSKRPIALSVPPPRKQSRSTRLRPPTIAENLPNTATAAAVLIVAASAETNNNQLEDGKE